MSPACDCGNPPRDLGMEQLRVCPLCVAEQLPTTSFSGKSCANPYHAEYHKERRRRERQAEAVRAQEDAAGAAATEGQAQTAERTSDEYATLIAKGVRCGSANELRKSAKAFREAIALQPDHPGAYFNLAITLSSSGNHAEAAKRFLEAMQRYPEDSGTWAMSAANAFDNLRHPSCAEVAKPAWWRSDDELKALSARVVIAAPAHAIAHLMRATVLDCSQWAIAAGRVRSPAEMREAAAHYERVAELHPSRASQDEHTRNARGCREAAEKVEAQGAAWCLGRRGLLQ